MSRFRKKRAKRKRAKLGVSLFPFLAVLICTLGVLIVMLVMAVKSAEDDAAKEQANEDGKIQQKVDDLETAKEVRLAQIEGLSLVRPEALDRLKESRDHRSYLEEQVRELKSEYKRVGDQLIELERQTKQLESPAVAEPSEFSEEQAEVELNSLREQIASAKSKLESKRELANRVKPASYVIVPHKGGGGTFRRPIFLECTKDAVVLQPSGIRLEKSEFVPPLEPGNMIDSALLAIREYWQRYDLAGEEGSPYPLMVVRPDGAQTFVLARSAMKSWDDEFGYELVESDTELDFGEKDTQLEEELKVTIQDARNRQRYRVAQAAAFARSAVARRAGRGGRSGRPGLMASGAQGGFVSNAGGFDDGFSDDGFSDDGFSKKAGTNDRGFDSNESGLQAFRSPSDQSTPNTYQGNGSSGQNDFAARNFEGEPGGGSSESTQIQDGQAGGQMKVGNPYANQSLARERGTNWALPTQTPGATGYLRPIRVVCGANFVDIFSGGTAKRIAISNDKSAAIDPMVDEIWKSIDSWGIPGANAYWKPQLRVQVIDGGRDTFLQLKGLLFKSGMAIEESQR